ncbi:MAG: 2-oxoacid:acceptor oxidoreductase family protein [Nitrospinae bacterium]|nr:2-oxoacid:acceptor oxidoreductase family protein [Nitrospinota bacterium]
MKKDMLEMRWHGRAGQGIVTAAAVLAQVISKKGKYVQAYPEFGAEKRGAPVVAFNRVSNDPIRLHSHVKKPRIVLVVDPTLIKVVDICEGTEDDAIIIVNTSKDPTAVREKAGIRGRKICTLDASRISEEELGRPIPNMPMLGAFMKVTGMYKVDDLTSTIFELLEKRFSPKVVEENIRAIRRGFEEVIEG